MSIFNELDQVREVFITEDIKELSNDEIREILIGATGLITESLYEGKEAPFGEAMAAAINFTVNFLGVVLEASNRNQELTSKINELNKLFNL